MDVLLPLLCQPSLPRDCAAFVIGLIVGSFLNVLALRSLAETSIFWPPSHCMRCDHRLSPLDMIPVLSWFLLRGRCRYCHEPISWQYPAVEFLTACAFVVVLHYFGLNLEGVGMVVFACTLIVVCVTDFREKLIPHEITYPSMTLGLIYTGVCAGLSSGLNYNPMPCKIHHDVISGLAGVGISYILFDFLAFYGLKFYIATHGDPNAAREATSENEEEAGEETDPMIDNTFSLARSKESELEEEFEVMGGGDAVLAAVIAAWLGLTRLGTALVFGFMVGTVMGAVYLTIELVRQKMIRQCLRPLTIGALVVLSLFEGVLFFLYHLGNPLHEVSFFAVMPWWQTGLAGVGVGALLGVVSVGARVSKPFPFGPALAAGATIAMFFDPFGSEKLGGA